MKILIVDDEITIFLSTSFLIGCECSTSDSTINYFQKKGYVVFADKNIVVSSSFIIHKISSFL